MNKDNFLRDELDSHNVFPVTFLINFVCYGLM